MSRSQFQSTRFILTHAWLNLWDKHMTTGRINQVAIFTAFISKQPARSMLAISNKHRYKPSTHTRSRERSVCFHSQSESSFRGQTLRDRQPSKITSNHQPTLLGSHVTLATTFRPALQDQCVFTHQSLPCRPFVAFKQEDLFASHSPNQPLASSHMYSTGQKLYV